MLRLSVACCLCLLAAMAHAENEVRYITNKLFLTLTDQPDGTGAKLKTLTSGDAVTILESGQTFSKVQTADGIIGWLKASYLITEAPKEQQAPDDGALNDQAQLDKKIVELTQQNSALNKQLDEATKMLETSKNQITVLETRILDSENSQTNTTLTVAEPQQASTLATTPPASPASSLLQLVIVSIIALTIGLLSGAWWVDRKVKKRFAGYRVY